ncbi:protein-tyrosine-phosphatase [Corynebacterium mustelae]|uniref:protein-tyrosine-phosphatase n=1 Tax=Corynebacterium mustelae TaxID=571915 RepID=A0A0G3H5Z9_9CORY|nr:low molecular weight protein-tyrosine-phosphatase [Corynebacterium mustelae]AKK06572.1 protein-tyrosine-phosphatase [Corynebacterium mustelae]
MTAGHKLHITVVCTGNICRSPMGDVILSHAIRNAGLNDDVKVDSCGTGGWHVGEKADRRAITELRKAGYNGDEHRAAQFDDSHANADLIIAMDSSHVQSLLRLGIPETKIRLWRSFDPEAGADVDVEDPYYGYASDFELVRLQVEAGIPGIIDWIRTELEES